MKTESPLHIGPILFHEMTDPPSSFRIKLFCTNPSSDGIETNQ